MYKGILAALAVLLLLSSCGGGGAVPDEQSSLQPIPAYDQPGLPIGKLVTNGALPHGSTYQDPVSDVFQNWDWCMVFDYGDPIEGEDYTWADAELVEVDGNWYMSFTFSDDVSFPGFPNAGWTPGASFYGFADLGVHVIDPGGTMPVQAGKFDYTWDITSPPDGKVAPNDFDLIPGSYMLPLFGGGKKGNLSFDPDDYPDGFEIAIHATVTYIEWVEAYTDESGVYHPAYHAYFGDDTGWGFNCSKADEFPLSWEHPWASGWGGWSSSEALLPLFSPVLDKCYNAWNPGPFSYWRVVFDDQTWYPFPGSNDWVGWCVDNRTMYPGQDYCVDVYSCYDGLPDYAVSDHWDLISWIINEMNNGDGTKWYHRSSGSFNLQKAQRAIWHFKYGNAGGMDPATVPSAFGVNFAATHPDVAALIQDAMDLGENYYPGPGEWYAVILVPNHGYPYGTNTEFQMNIIEVDP